MYNTCYSCQILKKSSFLHRFSKNTQILNFMKINSVAAELFQEDGGTDMKKLAVAFHNFANEPCDKM
jgi:hypothetical protein